MLMMTKCRSLNANARGRERFLLAGVVFALFLPSAAAQAAQYGDFLQPEIDYIGVGDMNGNFGSPTATSNQLSFGEALFTAGCVGATCTSGVDTLSYDARTGSGFGLSRIRIDVTGGASRTDDVGTGSALATATANVFIDIFEVDGQAVDTINVSEQLLFAPLGESPADTTYLFLGDGTPGTTGELFFGTLDVDLDAILAANAATGSVTRADVSIGLTLTAFADAGNLASIEVGDFRVDHVLVPEPASALMIGLGLSVLARRRMPRA